MTALTTFGPLATKTVGRDPDTGELAILAGYGDAAHFRVTGMLVPGVIELHAALTALAAQPRTFVVRGEPLADTKRQRCRRLLHDAVDDDGVVIRATFREAARRWLALDCDSLDCPAGLDWINDPRGTVSYLALMVPPEFAGVGCVVQATSGAGIKHGIRVRAWYLLDRPVSDGDLQRWLSDAPLDHSIFRAVQPIYTAAPVLCGVPDPMPWRVRLVAGPRDRVTVPELPEPPAPAPLAPRERAHVAGPHYALAALEAECRAVVAAGVGDRHPAINRAGFKLARFVASGELELRDVEACLIAAAWDAGLPDGEAELRRFIACGLIAGQRGHGHGD